jgi:predicted Zn finger-like uncharacterized protein
MCRQLRNTPEASSGFRHCTAVGCQEEDGSVVVTCERCATQFQLDDERVPEDGVRVRCSRCKHAFFIERPAQNEAEKIHRVARRAVDAAPEVTKDLDDVGDPLPSDDELDEEDWQFADDAPFGGGDYDDPAGLSAAGVVDDLLGHTGGASPAAPASEHFDVSGLTPEDAGGDLAEDDLAEEEGMSLSLEDDDEPFSAPGSSTESAPNAELADADGTPSLSLAEDPVHEAGENHLDHGVVDIGGADAAGSGLELDGPESGGDATDLLADLRDELEDEVSAVAAPMNEAPPVRQREVLTQPTRPVAVAPEQDELGGLEDWGLAEEGESPTVATGLTSPTRSAVRAPMDLEEEISPRAQWLARAGSFVGWICVIGLFAVGLHGGVALEAAPAAPSPETVHVGGFDVSDVNTHWIDNLHVGPTLVISGTLRNTAASASTGLGVALLGADGQPIAETLIAVGPALGEAMLRGTHPNAFAEAQRELGADGWPWQPGQERRFHAVARAAPDSAAWVRFAAVEHAMSPPVAAPLALPEAAGALDPAAAVAPAVPGVEGETESGPPTTAGPSTPR